VRGGLLTTPFGIELLHVCADIQILSSGMPTVPFGADTDKISYAMTNAAFSQPLQ